MPLLTDRYPLTIIEFDIDYCANTYGVAPCTAALGGFDVRKCYNGFFTCQDQTNFTKTTKTIRLCEPRSNLPRNLGTVFPCITSIAEEEARVNVVGADDRLGPLGERAEITVTFDDFPDHDRYLDKYAQERVSGVAQTDEGGYDPFTRSTWLVKLLKRHPYHFKRAMRRISGYVENNSFVPVDTKHYIIEDIEGPTEDGAGQIVGSDIMSSFLDDRAVAPFASKGYLKNDIDSSQGSLTLTPAGIGDLEYPASGIGVIGSEMVVYTRSGDSITMTTRGYKATKAASHSAGDSFQQALQVVDMRVDDYAYLLANTYSKMDPAQLPLVSEWKPEVDRWASGVLVNTTITTPTGVGTLLAELGLLGVTLFPKDDGSTVGLRVNRPVDAEIPHLLTDDKNILSLSVNRRNDMRVSRIIYYTKQADPTKSVSDENNYDRVPVTLDPSSEGPNEYNSTHVRKLFCRLLNKGDDATATLVSIRILNKYRNPPETIRVALDYADGKDIQLMDFIEVQSEKISDVTGKPVSTRYLVIAKKTVSHGQEIEIEAEALGFVARYGFITEDTRPTYPLSTPAQRARGAYFADDLTLRFAYDNTEAYRFI